LRTPICAFCAKTGVLCPKCETKLKSGHIGKSDVEISVRLTKLADKLPDLDKVTLIRALDLGGEYIFVVTAGDPHILRKNPQTMKKIESELQGKVWLIEGDASDRKMLEDLFYPIRIATVNVVWLPDGSKITKVVISGRKTERLPLDIKKVKRIVKEVREIDLLVEFERY